MNYLELFQSCQITNSLIVQKELNSICRVILNNEIQYRTVEKFVSIPWPLIAVIHHRESDLNFKRHLHNGDSLGARTVHVPKGRPEHGEPPFTWIESAIDALDTQDESLWLPEEWTLPGALEFLERYNGLGYQKHSVNSPYLWNYTDKYKQGLYASDGNFYPLMIERRAGCVAVVKTLIEKGVSLDFTKLDAGDRGLH